jgi:hypothetical protein
VRAYVPPARLLVSSSIEFDGGPSNIQDLDSGYPEAYKRIWSVK